MKIPDISPELGLRAVKRMAKAADVEVILPGDVRRELFLRIMSTYHDVAKTGWSYEYAKENVTVTLPGAGPAADLLAHVPYVGGLLAQVARDTEHPCIMFSPASLRTGVGVVGTARHEFGHVGSIRKGGFLWCLAYGTIGEVRAGGEAPCYGVDLAHDVLLGGVDPVEGAKARVAALANYGLSSRDLNLAKNIMASWVASLQGGVDPAGTVERSLEALRAEGWAG